jgi:uncharacterized DUF497 family protein
LKFEWDPAKEKLNLAKHKVSFTEACHIFSDSFQLNLFDTDHSDDEDRWATIGSLPTEKILVVVHTVRMSGEETSVRIISARKASKKERETYYSRRHL